MPRFYNPYHFVPVPQGDARVDDLDVAEFEKNNIGHLTHDRYLSEVKSGAIYSGRLICRLTTEGPIFIGSQRKKRPDDDSHEVKPFELEGGVPALPASSLRGMISSIAEAASNSALRVLENMPYSRRMQVEEGNEVNKIGVLIRKHNLLRLLPLVKDIRNEVKRVGGYEKVDSPQPNPKPMLQIRLGSFLDNKSLKSYSPDNQEFWYKNGNRIIPLSDYKDLPGHQQKSYRRGILRILGIQGREEEIPTTKNHEYFIPYPDGIEDKNTLEATDAIKNFHKLADERTELDKNKKVPFELKGSQRNNNHDEYEQKIRLREGDIVFYKPDNAGEKVDELMISSIWRREIKGDCYDFFKQLSPELLPFSQKRRKKLTIAEQLFGFVENKDKKEIEQQTTKKSGLALSGRLRFSFGTLSSKGSKPFYDDQVLLRILDSPKPPCPTLYFKQNGVNTYIAKKDLREKARNTYIPQGRKFYLHHKNVDNQPWKTKHEKEKLSQKSWVTPIKKDSIFYFHIDFNNLSERELALLCYSIRPTENFRHKLGMGKPLGLGQVRIDPAGLFFINRSKRYAANSDLFNDNRYHSCWVNDDEDTKKWPEEGYQREQREYQNSLKKIKKSVFNKKGVFDSSDIFQPDSEIKESLELLGDPSRVNDRKKVHYPQVADNQDLEDKLYEWFVRNDDKKSTHLQPLPTNEKELPSLKKL